MSDQAKITLSGVITRIDEPVVIGNFERKAFRIKETTDQYPQDFPIELSQNYLQGLDNLKVGDTVECGINLRGREWAKGDKEGCFVTLQCWRIKKLADGSVDPSVSQQVAAPVPTGQSHNDDLPF